MQLLSYETFAGHVREAFSLSLGEAAVDVTLVEARRRPPRVSPGLRAEPSRFTSNAKARCCCRKKLYPLSNPGMGKIEIFIVPVAREKDGVIYEAVFN